MNTHETATMPGIVEPKTDAIAFEATETEVDTSPPLAPKPMPGSPTTPDETGGAGVDRWQQRLLPFMMYMILGLTVFFFLASLVQLALLHNKIWQGPEQNGKALFDILDRETFETSEGVLAAGGFEALAELELYTIQNRYHQAKALTISRVWVRYLGFVTGMALALVGATFILGKLREPPVQVGGAFPAIKFSFVGASPGIFLALVGLVLMMTTIINHRPIDVSDGAVYVDVGGLVQLNPQQVPVEKAGGEEHSQQTATTAEQGEEWLEKPPPTESGGESLPEPSRITE